MSSQKDVVTPSASASRLIGRVKWFNNKAGYGFITVTDGNRSGSDVFVHHSAISVENQQYKYLAQGEYVEFSEVNATSGPHQYQASNVLGVNGGKLMCETRREFKIARSNYKTSKNESDSQGAHLEAEPVTRPKQKRVTRDASPPREGGEVSRDTDKNEWTLVKKAAKRAPRAPRKQTVNETK